MEKIKLSILMIITLLMMTGCASISEEQCRIGDWYQLGLEDGRQGKKNQAANYSGDCAEYKVSVDLEKYNAGRDQGLKSYCSYDNGAFIGGQNASYEHVCPAELSSEFLAGYVPHKNLAQAESDVQSVERRLSNLRKQLKNEDLSEDDIKDIRADIKANKRSLTDRKSAVHKYEYQLALHRIDRALNEIESELADTSLTASQQQRLQSKRDELESQRKEIEEVYSVTSTIESIKHVMDLFK